MQVSSKCAANIKENGLFSTVSNENIYHWKQPEE